MLNFEVKSKFDNYNIEFCNIDTINISEIGTHFIIDKNVAECYNINFNNSIIIDAYESQKSYQAADNIIDNLVKMNMRRDSHLIAIGGGITQDITCWIASTFMRGIPWSFVPTTLLAQTDSCIGSKSSINFNQYKNLLGTFNPPKNVYIDNKFRNTLDNRDIKSGLSELIKLMIIDNCDEKEIFKVSISRPVKDEYIAKGLLIKKYFIEVDEFDKGIRNLLNYGHCFGHAIESASNYSIPHGIAVAFGMDFANALTNKEWFNKYHNILYILYSDFLDILNDIELDQVFEAMNKDKKNVGGKLSIIAPDQFGLRKQQFINDSEFRKKCIDIFEMIKD